MQGPVHSYYKNVRYVQGSKKTHIVFESIFRSNAVNFLYGVRGHIQAWGLTVIDHQ